MKIRLVTPETGPRTGSRTYASRVAALMARDHTVHVTSELSDDAAGHDVIHVLDLKSLVLRGTKAHRSRAGALVLDIHDDYWTGEPRYPGFDRPLRRWLWRRRGPLYRGWLAAADQVVVHAGHMQRAVVHERVTEVPYPADAVSPRASHIGDPDVLRVLFAGRDSLRKGLEVLGEALRILARGGPKPHLTVAGKDWPHLRAAARVWLRGVDTTFAGELDEPAMDGAYRAADVVALPSWTETFGLVAQEAMLRGVPVVGTTVGGLGPLIEGTEGGIVVPPGDALGLAGALREIHAAPGLWGERAARAGTILVGSRNSEVTRAALDRAYHRALDRISSAPTGAEPPPPAGGP